MAYHSSDPKPSKPKSKKSTDAEKLKEASKHHSKKHMDMMKKLMKEGKTFSQAHKMALAKVGK
jgi:hypothetical protein|tara:strand:- start:301 stop:489 length:189 start_codon:yes stop_codon:yes gene_type:complete